MESRVRNLFARICAGSLALGFSSVLAACEKRVQADSLLGQNLIAVMEDRRQLWVTPTAEGGSRRLDISEIICPLLPKDFIRTLNNDSSLREFLEYQFLEDVGYYPENSNQIRILIPLDDFRAQSLTIVVSEEHFCVAQYRHII